MARSPIELLGALGTAESQLLPDLRHVEIYTQRGLLLLLWHGPPDAHRVVVTLGGAVGGLLGPGRSLYQQLGERLSDDGTAVARLHYRRAGQPDDCLLDAAAVCDRAMRQGATRFVFVGHSFGGAIAIQAATMIGAAAAGVVLLSTQSAGCEGAGQLAEETDLLLVHGTGDQVLGPENSEMVRAMAGRGEVVLVDAGHGLAEVADDLDDLEAARVTEMLTAGQG